VKIPEAVKQAARVLEESGEREWHLVADDLTVSRGLSGRFYVYKTHGGGHDAPTLAEVIEKADRDACPSLAERPNNEERRMFEKRISEPWHGIDGRKYALALNEKGEAVIAVHGEAAGWTEIEKLTLIDGYAVARDIDAPETPVPEPQNEEIPAGDGSELPTRPLGPPPGSVAGE
jgi:hypothetical protein